MRCNTVCYITRSARYCQGFFVRLSVRLSNACIVTKRKKHVSHSYTVWKNVYPSFPTRRMVGRGRPIVPESLGQTDPVGAKNADFQSIIARSASAVTPSEKVQLTLLGSPLTRFPISLRWTLYVTTKPPSPPPKWAQKRKTAVFYLKLHFVGRKSVKRFICVILSVTSCKAFIGLFFVQNSSRGTSSTTWRFGRNCQPPSKNADFRSIFACSASGLVRNT